MIEPAIARWLSCFNNKFPSRLLSYFSFSKSFIFGTGVRTDSMIPFLSFVSGKHFIMNGAKRSSLCSASSTSSIPSSICSIASPQAVLSEFFQNTSFSLRISFRIGVFSSSTFKSTIAFIHFFPNDFIHTYILPYFLYYAYHKKTVNPKK